MFRAALTVASLLSLANVARAATPPESPSIVRVGAGGFPISGIVVVKTPGGMDVAYASGATAPSAPGSPVTGDTKAQTVATLTRLSDALKSQGFGLGDIVMMRVFLVGTPETSGKMDFAGMMAGYTQFFATADQPNKPARTTVQVVGLAAPGALVEIEAQVAKPHS